MQKDSLMQQGVGSLLIGKTRQLFNIDFWSLPQEEVALTNAAGDKALPDVIVAGIPSGATIEKAIAIFKFRVVENTNVAANKLAGAQEIQIRDDSPSAWVDAINLVDDMFSLAASTREGGDVFMGAINVSAVVLVDDTYNFQWAQGVADLDGIVLNDLQTGIRIWYSV